jgi:predicted alpha/beta superfamily hydrolase
LLAACGGDEDGETATSATEATSTTEAADATAEVDGVREPPTSRAGELVTEVLEYDGGRRVTVYIPSDPVEAVVFAADGGWHITRLSEALQGAVGLSTMVVGVHGLEDDDGRLREYVPGFDAARFAAHERFFVDDVPRWVEARFGIALPAERTGVWGASLGGEFALAMGLRHPDLYGAVFSASPGAGYQPPEELPSLLPRVYLVAGSREQFFLDNASRWEDALRRAGADVAMMERDGEHGGEFWFEEFPLMLEWAFGR